MTRNKTIYAPNGFKYKPQFHKDNKTGKEYKYIALTTREYYSKRYGKSVVIYSGDRSDGATGAFDIPSFSWWVHDDLCKNGHWQDGTKVTNYQASQVLFDILWEEGHYLRAFRWKWATFFCGGGKAKDNGMFWVSHKVLES